jgi:hypothetical protein
MSKIHSVLFDSFADAPEAWKEIYSPDDLAMDARVLAVFQRTLQDQCRCWGLIVFDGSKVIGCAALCAFRSGLLRVLFCGLPVPSGSKHLCVREGASAEIVIQEVERAMRILAATQKCQLLVFKEFSNASEPLFASLPALGYIRGGIPPMHVLEASFVNFAEYQQSLKNRYRAQVKRSRKKLVDAGFEMLCGRGTDFFMQHFNEEVHGLYVAVQKRAKHKLELMPASFFSEMAKALGDEVLLTLIRRNGRVCAFTFSITRAGTHYNLYSGLDYAFNNEGDLYFNLFYNDMDQAFRAGVTSLHLGQTSDDFKSRLGTHTEQLYFFVRARSSVFNWILRLVSPFAFPKVKSVEPHHVFSNQKES